MEELFIEQNIAYSCSSLSIGMVYVLVTKAGISLETVLVAAVQFVGERTGLLQSNKRREATITFVIS